MIRLEGTIVGILTGFVDAVSDLLISFGVQLPMKMEVKLVLKHQIKQHIYYFSTHPDKWVTFFSHPANFIASVTNITY